MTRGHSTTFLALYWELQRSAPKSHGICILLVYVFENAQPGLKSNNVCIVPALVTNGQCVTSHHNVHTGTLVPFESTCIQLFALIYIATC